MSQTSPALLKAAVEIDLDAVERFIEVPAVPVGRLSADAVLAVDAVWAAEAGEIAGDGPRLIGWRLRKGLEQRARAGDYAAAGRLTAEGGARLFVDKEALQRLRPRYGWRAAVDCEASLSARQGAEIHAWRLVLHLALVGGHTAPVDLAVEAADTAVFPHGIDELGRLQLARVRLRVREGEADPLLDARHLTVRLTAPDRGAEDGDALTRRLTLITPGDGRVVSPAPRIGEGRWGEVRFGPLPVRRGGETVVIVTLNGCLADDVLARIMRRAAVSPSGTARLNLDVDVRNPRSRTESQRVALTLAADTRDCLLITEISGRSAPIALPVDGAADAGTHEIRVPLPPRSAGQPQPSAARVVLKLERFGRSATALSAVVEPDRIAREDVSVEPMGNITLLPVEGPQASIDTMRDITVTIRHAGGGIAGLRGLGYPLRITIRDAADGNRVEATLRLRLHEEAAREDWLVVDLGAEAIAVLRAYGSGPPRPLPLAGEVLDHVDRAHGEAAEDLERPSLAALPTPALPRRKGVLVPSLTAVRSLAPANGADDVAGPAARRGWRARAFPFSLSAADFARSREAAVAGTGEWGRRHDVAVPVAPWTAAAAPGTWLVEPKPALARAGGGAAGGEAATAPGAGSIDAGTLAGDVLDELRTLYLPRADGGQPLTPATRVVLPHSAGLPPAARDHLRRAAAGMLERGERGPFAGLPLPAGLMPWRAAEELTAAVALVPEPVAVAYALAHRLAAADRHTSTGRYHLLALDFGAGTLDVALVTVRAQDGGPAIEAVDSAFSIGLGGQELDAALAQLIDDALTQAAADPRSGIERAVSEAATRRADGAAALAEDRHRLLRSLRLGKRTLTHAALAASGERYGWPPGVPLTLMVGRIGDADAESWPVRLRTPRVAAGEELLWRGALGEELRLVPRHPPHRTAPAASDIVLRLPHRSLLGRHSALTAYLAMVCRMLPERVLAAADTLGRTGDGRPLRIAVAGRAALFPPVWEGLNAFAAHIGAAFPARPYSADDMKLAAGEGALILARAAAPPAMPPPELMLLEAEAVGRTLRRSTPEEEGPADLEPGGGGRSGIGALFGQIKPAGRTRAREQKVWVLETVPGLRAWDLTVSPDALYRHCLREAVKARIFPGDGPPELGEGERGAQPEGLVRQLECAAGAMRRYVDRCARILPDSDGINERLRTMARSERVSWRIDLQGEGRALVRLNADAVAIRSLGPLFLD